MRRFHWQKIMWVPPHLVRGQEVVWQRLKSEALVYIYMHSKKGRKKYVNIKKRQKEICEYTYTSIDKKMWQRLKALVYIYMHIYIY